LRKHRDLGELANRFGTDASRAPAPGMQARLMIIKGDTTAYAQDRAVDASSLACAFTVETFVDRGLKSRKKFDAAVSGSFKRSGEKTPDVRSQL
jgi:hypothetical protein